jgi:DNA-binding transcriptional regulator YhcF (GntR family)
MLINIDMTSDTPIYEQLKQQVIHGIAARILKEGDALPSVRQLAADLSVNMHTVAKAYAQLKDDGFISIHRRRGALINAPAAYAANDKYIDELKHQLGTSATQAMCRGITWTQWQQLCLEAYKNVKDMEGKQ